MESDDVWGGDLLGRQAEGEYLRNYIERLFGIDKKDHSSFVLNINSEWGYGKTWFLQNLAKELNRNHPVVYFDAWKYDFSKDALLSFVSFACQELAKQFDSDSNALSKLINLKSTFAQIAKKAIPVVASVAVKKLTGFTVGQINENYEDINWDSKEAGDFAQQLTKIASICAVEEFLKKKEALELFNDAINELIEELEKRESYLPICIFIDELDRCRPTYAIELLEAVKHLFSVKGIFFILATDTEQLCHSIKAVYGEGFNAGGYLKRFFYAEYVLASPDCQQVANFLFNSSANVGKYLFLPASLFQSYGYAGVFAKLCEFFKLTIRDQEQVFRIVEAVILGGSRKDFDLILLLLLVCLKHKFPMHYALQSNIKSHVKFKEFISEGRISAKIKNVGLKSRYYYEGSANDREFSIQELLEHYFGLLDGDLNNSKLDFTSGFTWKEEISAFLRQGAVRDSRKKEFIGYHDLPTYFDLLDQAGRAKLVIN